MPLPKDNRMARDVFLAFMRVHLLPAQAGRLSGVL
jgi:hypothetical protein